MTQDKFENLLLDLCFADWKNLPADLRQIGLRISFLEDYSTIVIHGAIQCGFSMHEDPQGRAIQISMAIAGGQASLYFPNLLKKVDCRKKLLLRNKIIDYFQN